MQVASFVETKRYSGNLEYRTIFAYKSTSRNFGCNNNETRINIYSSSHRFCSTVYSLQSFVQFIQPWSLCTSKTWCRFLWILETFANIEHNVWGLCENYNITQCGLYAIFSLVSKACRIVAKKKIEKNRMKTAHKIYRFVVIQ